MAANTMAATPEGTGGTLPRPDPAQLVARDQAARREALDVGRSFVVQAPAGSGKTTLLIQRFLALLAIVGRPEEVVAITFTRKAAAEMRQRVVQALAAAAAPDPVEGSAAGTADELTAALARAADLAHPPERNGGARLAEQPGRLRIGTIDALCSAIVRRLPVSSTLGAAPRVAEDAGPLLREAARATVQLRDDEGEVGRAVRALLLHLDHDSTLAEELLVAMLERREQWLPVLPGEAAEVHRRVLEAALGRARRASFAAAAAQVAAAGPPLATALWQLPARAAANLAADAQTPITGCRGLERLPAVTAAGEAAWLGLADFWLTQKGSPRRSFTQALGVLPAGSGARRDPERARFKAECDAVAEALEGRPELVAAFDDLRRAPRAAYDEAQWEVLGAIVRVLRLAAAQLELSFADHATVDFTAMMQAAARALGSAEEPGEALLAFDARVSHLLIDEFQDTSRAQFAFVEHLTAGWNEGDGRTLFVVGDPMQSIYRFRQAEVELFLRARDRGIGTLRPVALRLARNFRAQAALVDWVNHAFARVLAPRDDPAAGAVAYEPSAAVRPGLAGPAVRVVASVGDAGTERPSRREAAQVVDCVRAAQAEQPEGRIAILVRARGHLAAIEPALREAGVATAATEIETLGEQPAVADLVALTRALDQPADRVAVLAALRAPWCGLTLADLHVLVEGDPAAPLPALWDEPARHGRLSADGRARLAHFVAAWRPAWEARARVPLHLRVEQAWLALGGPGCLGSAAAAAHAEAYFARLERHLAETLGGALEPLALARDLERQPAAGGAGSDGGGEGPPPVELLTLHKAKGLEFDTVIVPGLDRAPRRDNRPLLSWLERERAEAGHGEAAAELLIAPVQAAGTAAGDDPTAAWIEQLRTARDRLEAGRLLYVACTRARRRLVLLGHALREAGAADAGLRSPHPDALLSLLWPVVAPEFAGAAASPAPAPAAPQPVAPAPLAPPLRRLPTGWRAPPPAADLPWPRSGHGDHPVVPWPEFSWAGEAARQVGIVVHAALQRIAGEGLEGRTAAAVADGALHDGIRRQLAASGLPAAHRDEAAGRVLAALRGALADPRGRWVLGPQADARAEWRLTAVLEGEAVDVAIDRSFVDDAGTRWIVDYKTGRHEGGGREAFLDRELERYRPQLDRYARVLQAAGAGRVRCGLYFPLLAGWREWDPGAG